MLRCFICVVKNQNYIKELYFNVDFSLCYCSCRWRGGGGSGSDHHHGAACQGRVHQQHWRASRLHGAGQPGGQRHVERLRRHQWAGDGLGAAAARAGARRPGTATPAAQRQPAVPAVHGGRLQARRARLRLSLRRQQLVRTRPGTRGATQGR
jgi:hypothetical protein